LLVGDPDIFADALVGDDFIGRLAQDPGARDRKLAHDRIEFALVADRAAEPAILFKITRRVRHHSKNIGVAVLAQDLTGAFAGFGRIAVVDTGHGSSPEVFGFVVGCSVERQVPFENVSASRRWINSRRHSRSAITPEIRF
jgi:hypothetical protein